MMKIVVAGTGKAVDILQVELKRGVIGCTVSFGISKRKN